MNDFEKQLLKWSYSKGPSGGYRQPNMAEILDRFHKYEKRIKELKQAALLDESMRENNGGLP